MNEQTQKILTVEESLDQFFSTESVNEYCCIKCTLLKNKQKLGVDSKEKLNEVFDNLLKRVDEISCILFE